MRTKDSKKSWVFLFVILMGFPICNSVIIDLSDYITHDELEDYATIDEIIGHNDAATSCVSLASTDIPWTEDVDTNASFDGTTFTAKYAGMYQVECNILIDFHAYDAGNRIYLESIVDGGVYIEALHTMETAFSAYITLHQSFTYKCAVGTTIKFQIYHGHASAITLYAGYNKLSIVRLY